MSDEGFTDPVPAPEGGGGLRAAELVGQFCLFRVTGEGMWDAKPAQEATADTPAKPAQEAKPYIECDVWTFDRAGQTGSGTGVRVSWWKAVEQLKAAGIGAFVAARPMTAPGSKAVELVTLEGDARKAATALVADIKTKEAADALGGEEVPEGEEAF